LLLEKQGSAEKGSHSYQDAQLNMEMCNGDAKHTKWKMQENAEQKKLHQHKIRTRDKCH